MLSIDDKLNKRFGLTPAQILTKLDKCCPSPSLACSLAYSLACSLLCSLRLYLSLARSLARSLSPSPPSLARVLSHPHTHVHTHSAPHQDTPPLDSHSRSTPLLSSRTHSAPHQMRPARQTARQDITSASRAQLSSTSCSAHHAPSHSELLTAARFAFPFPHRLASYGLSWHSMADTHKLFEKLSGETEFSHGAIRAPLAFAGG
eukprot:1474907-Rhodomonas_salina.2